MASASSSPQSTEKSNPATLNWEIDDFANLNSKLISQTFSFENDDKIKFTLKLYPESKNELVGNTTSIILHFSPGENVTFHFALWIINANGEKCLKQEAKAHFIPKIGFTEFGQINFWKPYLCDSSNKLLTNGKLKIYCEVTKVDDSDSFSGKDSNQEKPSKIVEDFKSLLESESFSDTVFAVGEKEFRVHKAILAARSTVFKAMFEHDCEEKKQNRVEIIDLDVEVCEEFLRYIYSGNVTSLDRFAPELMAAADKYQLDELKSACEQFLCHSLDINSVASVLQLADMHNAEQLKSKCIEYITANAKDVQDTEGWKKLFIAKPELGFQLFLKVANRK